MTKFDFSDCVVFKIGGRVLLQLTGGCHLCLRGQLLLSGSSVHVPIHRAKAGVGATVNLSLGGKMDMPAIGLKGVPLSLKGEVITLKGQDEMTSSE